MTGGVKFSFQKSKKLDLQKLMGGYIFHFKNRFFSKGENLACQISIYFI